MAKQNVSGIFDQMRVRRLNEENDTPETIVEETPAAEEAVEVDVTDVQVEVEGAESEVSAEVSEEEMNEAVKKVVRDGKVETKNISTHKKRLTAEQKKALAKARKKAHTASANKERAKSMKKRRSMNMEDSFTCHECGFEGIEDDFEDEDGHLYCPECGAEVCCEKENESCKKKNESCKKNEEVDVAELAVRLDEYQGSEYMKRALNEGKYELVQRYLSIKEGE